MIKLEDQLQVRKWMCEQMIKLPPEYIKIMLEKITGNPVLINDDTFTFEDEFDRRVKFTRKEVNELIEQLQSATDPLTNLCNSVNTLFKQKLDGH
ncbi:MAG: hypothetical protein K2Y22_03980 [Candidatus Obscuribacterales bacterium]|nr:hypothetical protein [Candidatus Obscuribacterales bacterium]